MFLNNTEALTSEDTETAMPKHKTVFQNAILGPRESSDTKKLTFDGFERGLAAFGHAAYVMLCS
jgi:hypothetical protein